MTDLSKSLSVIPSQEIDLCFCARLIIPSHGRTKRQFTQQEIESLSPGINIWTSKTKSTFTEGYLHLHVERRHSFVRLSDKEHLFVAWKDWEDAEEETQTMFF